MRILQILDARWDSGIMRYGLSLAEALQARGHEVRVWALPGRPPFAAAVALGLPTASCARPLLRFAALRRELQRDPVDLVNAHSGSGHTLAAALNATLPRPFALVRTRGDARPMRERLLNGWRWRRTHGFIAGNAAILDRFRERHPDDPPARAVYWGLDWPDPGPPEAEAPLRIGMVARLDRVKGHDTLLEAAALLRAQAPEAEVWLAGAETSVPASYLRAKAESLGLAVGVHVMGFVGRIQRFYQSCHVGVVASRGSEAVSRAATEWMASGRPLVATAVGCLPELVDHGRTGFVVPSEDPPALAARLVELARDPALRERFGRAARRRYEQRFRTEPFVSETLKLYQDALHHLSPR